MRAVLRGLAETLVTAGLLLAFFVGYLAWGTSQYMHQEQGGLQDELEQRWSAARARQAAATTRNGSGGAPGVKAGASAPAEGEALAILRVPRFGASYRYAVIEGVSEEDLRRGPGHYPGTAGPGQVGNMAVAGHRTTYGSPFNRNGDLKRGDRILVDTATATYVYEVTGRVIVRPGETGVIAPVPRKPGRKPVKRMLTLTTCHPKFSAAYRLVVFAELQGRRAPAA
ncbi:class E sortase [Actinomadura sp. 7K507]|uniref:class E sortase n=1 Tax=Actinomadura sp. 7K507 TaxID=2530365 RepID=UPI00104E92CA|nr:class E sortase [Actinomadura sp. 7K507]TDC77807.1 class E sortase [Actinomadura sp. 7K507]